MDGRSGALERDEPGGSTPAAGPAEPARKGRSPHPRSRLRAVYFGVASFWGFVAGTVAVAVVAGEALPRFSATAVGVLAAAAAVAIVGGIVVALAYREVAHRRSR